MGGVIDGVDADAEVDRLHPEAAQQPHVLGGGAAGGGGGRSQHPDGAGADERQGFGQHLRRGLERRGAEQHDLRLGVGRHAEGAGAAPEAVGAQGGAQPFALERAAEVQRRHPEAALGRGDQAARAPRLPLEADGDVQARPGVEGLGAVGAVGFRIGQHQPRQQVVERIGAEGVAPRAGRGAVGDLALAHPPLAGARLRPEPGEVDAVAVVEVAEAEVAEALPRGIDRRRPDVDDHDAVLAADPRRLSLDQERGVLVDAEAAARPGGDHGDDQPAEPAALDEVLVEHAVGKEPEPGAEQQARAVGIVGDAVHHGFQRGAAENHRLRHHRGAGAGARHQPAGGAGGADRRQHRGLAAAGGQGAHDLGLIAAGEVDAAIGGDAGAEVRVVRHCPGVLGGQQHRLGLEAVLAEDLQALLAHGRGLGGGGGEDQDAAAGQPVHLGEDRDVVVLQPAADDGEAACGRDGGLRRRRGHALPVSLPARCGRRGRR